MNLEEFVRLLDTYGANLSRWPERHREATARLLRDSAEARSRWSAAETFEALFHADRDRDFAPDRKTAITNEALRRIRLSSEQPFDWRWLFTKRWGAVAAAMILAGWFAGVVLGPAIQPLPPHGASAVAALLGGDPLTIESFL